MSRYRTQLSRTRHSLRKTGSESSASFQLGEPAMLISNLDVGQGLVNGAMCKVAKLLPDKVVVQLSSHSGVYDIEYVTSTVGKRGGNSVRRA